MALQDSSRTGFYISEETLWGEDPAVTQPAMDQLRITGESLAFSKETRTSDVIREDGQIDSVALVGFSTGGAINIEAAIGQYSKLFEGLMTTQKAGPAAAITGVSVTAPSTFVKSNIINEGLAVGQRVFASGFASAANNGVFEVVTITTNSITVTATTLVTVGASGTLKGAMLRNGIIDHSYLIEKAFAQASAWHYYNGLRVGGLSLNLQAGELAAGSFSLMGKDAIPKAAKITGARNAVAPSDPMSASANVGTLSYNGAAYAGAIRGVTLQVQRALRQQPKVGQTASAGVGVGRFNLTGTINIYFADNTEYNAMRAHSYQSLSIPLVDNAGEHFVITIPKLVFTGGPVNAEGIDQDVILPLTFQAVRDPVTGTTLQLDQSIMTGF